VKRKKVKKSIETVVTVEESKEQQQQKETETPIQILDEQESQPPGLLLGTHFISAEDLRSAGATSSFIVHDLNSLDSQTIIIQLPEPEHADLADTLSQPMEETGIATFQCNQDGVLEYCTFQIE
jgi:hypothetical protein